MPASVAGANTPPDSTISITRSNWFMVVDFEDVAVRPGGKTVEYGAAAVTIRHHDNPLGGETLAQLPQAGGALRADQVQIQQQQVNRLNAEMRQNLVQHTCLRA